MRLLSGQTKLAKQLFLKNEGDRMKETGDSMEIRKRKKSYEIDMCDGPLLGKIVVFYFPLMLSGVLQLLFNAADVIVVGQFAGDEALAAVGSNSPLINLMVNVFIGLSVGTNVLVSRYYGGRTKERTGRDGSYVSVDGRLQRDFSDLCGLFYCKTCIASDGRTGGRDRIIHIVRTHLFCRNARDDGL